MAVLKCEAYGHGAVKAARLLNGCGVRAFAVACAAEGVQLRRAGVRGVILDPRLDRAGEASTASRAIISRRR